MAKQVQREKSWPKWRTFIRGPWVLLWILIVVVLILLVYWALNLDQLPEWMGFGGRVDNGMMNSLSDWLGLMLVLVVFLGIIYWWRRSTLKIEQATVTATLVHNSVESFVDRMMDLMMERGLRESQEGDEIRILARALTSTALRNVDGLGKGYIVEFLHQSSLLNVRDPIVDLSELQLTTADLQGYNLVGASLQRTDLRNALLRSANLSTADLRASRLENSDMSQANLRESYLREADLTRVTLKEANLSAATLTKAILIDSDLSKANLERANLSFADLTGADLSGANLRSSKLRGAKIYKGKLQRADLRLANLSNADLESSQTRKSYIRRRKSKPRLICGCKLESSII